MKEDAVWLEIREPNCVPRRKGPFKPATLAATLREFMDAWPKSLITVVTFDAYGRPDFQDAPEALMMADGRSKERARRHIETSRSAFTENSMFTAAIKEASGYRMRPDGSYFKPGS